MAMQPMEYDSVKVETKQYTTNEWGYIMNLPEKTMRATLDNFKFLFVLAASGASIVRHYYDSATNQINPLTANTTYSVTVLYSD